MGGELEASGGWNWKEEVGSWKLRAQRSRTIEYKPGGVMSTTTEASQSGVFYTTRKRSLSLIITVFLLLFHLTATLFRFFSSFYLCGPRRLHRNFGWKLNWLLQFFVLEDAARVSLSLPSLSVCVSVGVPIQCLISIRLDRFVDKSSL